MHHAQVPPRWARELPDACQVARAQLVRAHALAAEPVLGDDLDRLDAFLASLAAAASD